MNLFAVICALRNLPTQVEEMEGILDDLTGFDGTSPAHSRDAENAQQALVNRLIIIRNQADLALAGISGQLALNPEQMPAPALEPVGPAEPIPASVQEGLLGGFAKTDDPLEALTRAYSQPEQKQEDPKPAPQADVSAAEAIVQSLYKGEVFDERPLGTKLGFLSEATLGMLAQGIGKELGRFTDEARAVNPDTGEVYLTWTLPKEGE